MLKEIGCSATSSSSSAASSWKGEKANIKKGEKNGERTRVDMFCVVVYSPSSATFTHLTNDLLFTFLFSMKHCEHIIFFVFVFFIYNIYKQIRMTKSPNATTILSPLLPEYTILCMEVNKALPALTTTACVSLIRRLIRIRGRLSASLFHEIPDDRARTTTNRRQYLNRKAGMKLKRRRG